VDVSAIEIGHSIHVRDLAIPEGVEILNDPDVSIMSVVAPTVEEVEEAPVEEGEEGAAAPEASEEGAPAEEAAEKKSDD